MFGNTSPLGEPHFDLFSDSCDESVPLLRPGEEPRVSIAFNAFGNWEQTTGVSANIPLEMQYTSSTCH
jgi:hypothetical protein